MPFGLLRFTRAWGAALALSTPTGCVGFIQPTAVTVSHEGTPTPPKPPREGYLRIWTTTNFAGLYTSWKDGSSRAKFKKLLVTIEVAGSGQEIPVLSLDITGQQPEAKNLIDEDFGRLVYVKLDAEDGSGTSAAPNVLLTVKGVPETAAGYIDQLVAVSTRLLNETPLGTSLAAVFPPGTGTVIKGVLGVVGQQAAAYKDKEWSRQMSASVRSQLALPHSQAVWILTPDDAALAAGAPGKPADASQANSLPPPSQIPDDLSACDQTGEKTGKLTHVCAPEPATGKLRVYDGYAWVSMEFELLAEPGADLIPDVVCGRLPDAAEVAANVSKMNAYKLSPKHRQELDSYIGAYQAAHAILTSGGVSQLVAFSRWLAHGGESLHNSAAGPASPAPAVETWSVVNVRRSALKACLLPALTSVDVALRYSDASKLKGLAAADATTPEKLYEVVSALDLVLGGEEPPPTADADVGQLKRQRGMFERRLYKEVFETVKTQAELARVLDTYPRCELCVVQGRKKRDSLAPSPAPGPRAIPVVEAPTIDASLAALNIDPTPLANARSSLARVMLLEEAGKTSAPDLASARTAWKQDAAAAEKLLIEEVKVSPAAAAEFIRYE